MELLIPMINIMQQDYRANQWLRSGNSLSRSCSRKQILMRILVTGAAGYVGSVVCQKLMTRDSNYEVVAVDFTLRMDGLTKHTKVTSMTFSICCWILIV